jgi:hypothetical protein
MLPVELIDQTINRQPSRKKNSEKNKRNNVKQKKTKTSRMLVWHKVIVI